MALTSGTKLGPYEIQSPLGAGGMGEVYRARDTRLERDVALKVLPAEVTGDASRRQRFELEARAVAALSHPNIVAVHDVGTESGVFYIVSELVDGESLRSAKFGLRKTLDIAVQIASGLAAAHAAGVTHRDLKPDNILLTRDGRVKIVDFGLAKISPASGAAGPETMTVNTEPGVVLGTAGYMSPEQVRGRDADHRSDIFSFGVILHELLTGQRTFHGETSAETMTAILRQDPPELPETVPSAVRQIVGHCLEKDPANRFQSARDLSFALAAMSQSGSHSATAAALTKPSSWRGRGLVALAALALIVLSVIADRLLSPATPSPSWSGVMLGGPEIAFNSRLSPDGHLLAMQAMVGDVPQVAVMKPESGNWSILTHNRDRGIIQQICWSPDGALIYYDRDTDVPQGIYSVPVLGGEERLVLEGASSPEALPDGTLLVLRLNAGRRYQVFRFWPDTGRLQGFPVQISLTASIFSAQLRVFPDGKEAIAFGTRIGPGKEEGRLLVIDLATGGTRPLTSTMGNDSVPEAWAVARDGKSVLVATLADGLLHIISMPRGGRSTPRTLLTLTQETWFLDAGPDGSVYVNLLERPTDLVRLSLRGERTERIAGFPLDTILRHHVISVLPDGRGVVSATAGGHHRLMVADRGKDLVPLVATTEETAAPLTAVGSTEVAFVIGPMPQETIAIAEVASGRITRRVAPGKGVINSLASSPDGKTLYFAASGSVWAIPSAGGEARMICSGDSATADPAGRGLVISRTETAGMRLFRVSLDGKSEQEILVDKAFSLMPIALSPNALSSDGRLLGPSAARVSWFNHPIIVDTSSGRGTRIPSDNLSDYHSLGWLPDGQVLALQIGVRAKIWKFTPKPH
jgi:serine/threonine protein kinase/sugar lactone lactonase YvrE